MYQVLLSANEFFRILLRHTTTTLEKYFANVLVQATTSVPEITLQTGCLLFPSRQRGSGLDLRALDLPDDLSDAGRPDEQLGVFVSSLHEFPDCLF